MFIALMMGMGMPTTASYVMSSAVATPALIALGCHALDVHLFVLYFAVLSSITPPVCVGAYTAAGIAGSSPNQTGFTAIKLALAGFVIPFVFIYSPGLLLTNVTSWPEFILVTISALVGVISLAIMTEGYFRRRLNPLERIAAGAAALALIVPGFVTDAAGYLLVGVLWFLTRQAVAKGGESKARS
jgi:TRAP-type uncharacterized transport system fused permease subunit